MFRHGIPNSCDKRARGTGQHHLLTGQAALKQRLVLRTLPWDVVVDHVIGVGSGAAGAVAAERTVHISGKVIVEIRDVEAALQARLLSHADPFCEVSSFHGLCRQNMRVGGYVWQRQ